MRRPVATIVASFALCWITAVSAAELAGVRLVDSVTLAGRELKLNGIGLRSVFIVKAYVAGLYVPQRSERAGELIAQRGPRRLAIHLLADTSSARFTKSINNGLRRNHGEAQLAAMQPQIAMLNATLAAIGTAKKGDLVTLDHAEGNTRIAVNDEFRGEPIPGEDFYAALLRIFLGENPVDDDLKRGLLGLQDDPRKEVAGG